MALIANEKYPIEGESVKHSEVVGEQGPLGKPGGVTENLPYMPRKHIRLVWLNRLKTI